MYTTRSTTTLYFYEHGKKKQINEKCAFRVCTNRLLLDIGGRKKKRHEKFFV